MRAIAQDPTNPHIMAIGGDCVRLFDLRKVGASRPCFAKLQHQRRVCGSEISGCAFSLDGKLVAASYFRHGVYVYNTDGVVHSYLTTQDTRQRKRECHERSAGSAASSKRLR
eukprot:Sspe_Gene.97776::Locus_71302_Transcript_2_4_Confidence_0.667_Length_433::g.97776::m.97776